MIHKAHRGVAQIKISPMKNFFVDADISRAQTISTDVYKSPEFFEMAKEKIFASSWQYAGDTDSLKTNGS